ncbi:extracellular solute-binding protein [Virgisporangium aliadipatigenens]|nr:extracellular solute-binding protein [Virgisporangium aliadipatigenens]
MEPPLAEASADRRRFLGMLGLGAAAVLGGPALAACSRRPGGTGSATGADAIKAVLPAQKPMNPLAKPDIDGVGIIPDGYLRYPSTLVDQITEKPGRGGTYKAIAPWWGPTPPALGDNEYVKAVNADLGATVDTSQQDGSTYSDKLSALMGGRDVPDILVAPNWEVGKISRFADGVKALFEDLTDHLKGDAAARYPNLASFPTSAWEYSVWGGRLAAVPFPVDGPFAWLLYYRKDLVDAAGRKAPTNIDEFYRFGKEMTNASAGVWAFGSVFSIVQSMYRCAGSSESGWRKKSGGGLEFKYETPEYRAAVEFTAKLFKDGLVHPDVVASKGADEKQLFKGGKIIVYQDGGGAWRGMQSEQLKVLPTFNMQPMPLFGVGGDPVLHGTERPIFWTFIKKGTPKDKVEEILRILNWCAAPLGTKEWELREYGVEGKHFTRGPDGSPAPTELGRKEIGSQFRFLTGPIPSVVQTADVPNYVQDLLGYSNSHIKFLEKDIFAGLKLELPANYAKLNTPTEDKILDILRGRRPISDLDVVVKEWRAGGGDEGRAFLEKALSDNGR